MEKQKIVNTKARIAFYVFLQTLPLLFSAIGVGCLFGIDNSYNDISKASPPLLVNGSGATMVATPFWRWMDDFPTYQTKFETARVQMSYLSVGSGLGRSDFFSGYSLFGATDSDISKAQLSFFLPDSTGSDISQVNITKYINPQTPQHLGNLMFPSICGALAIVYNLQGVNGTLIFNATVLGNIFSGSTTMWNDDAIQQLNPTVTLPAVPINVAGRGDSSGSTNVFTTYLSAYSPNFKKAIGISSQPVWPASFIKRNSAIELMYVCETLQNSITYVPLEAVIQANTASVLVAGIYNKRGRVVYPSIETVQEALHSSTPNSYQKHQFFSITDADSTNAYPISLMSFVLLRENYLYFAPPTSTTLDCDRVKELVLFWYFAFTNVLATSGLAKNGWVPISGKLLDFNLEALHSVTCNRVNMMNLIEIELGKHEFYGENEEKYLMDTSHSFWDVVGSSIGASPVGSAAYIIYYVAVSLAALIPYAINMKNYQKYKLKEDEEDQKAKVDDQDFGEETAIKPQDKGAPAQTNSTVPKAKRTIQNYVGVFTIFITMFQFVYLSLHRSIAIDSSSLLVSVISYVGLIIDSPIYYAILIIMAVVWVACLQYSIIVHPFLSRHHPFTAARLTSFHTFIALYLPNYVAIFYNPSVELFAKAFDCRLSHITNRFFNSFDPGHLHCFKGYHWAMVVLSFIYTTSFVFSVVRYSKILKSLRKNFDLKDKAWKIYFGSIIKCFVIILYFNVPSKAFLAVATILQLGLGLAVLNWRPNDYAWYDWLRGGSYLFCSFISGILFVLELVIQESNYTLRSLLKIPLIWGVFVSMIGFVVLGSLFAGRQFEMELSNAEKEKQKEEIAAFFAAFVQESLDEDDEGDVEEIVASVQASEGGVRASLTKRAGPSQMSSNSDQLQPHDAMQSYRRKSSIVSGFSSNKFGGSKLSLAHAKKLEPIIQKAKTSGLITNADARLLLKAIRNNDPLVYLLFKRCNGDFMVFKELLHIQAIHLFDEKFAGVAGDDLQLGTNKVGQSITSLGYPVSIQQQPPPLAHKLKDAAIIEEDE